MITGQVDRVADAGCSHGDDHEEEKKHDDAVGEAEADEADGRDDGAPENQPARTEAVEQEADAGTENAGLQLAQRHGG